MRKFWGAFAGAAIAVGAVSLIPARAAAPTSIDKNLLGVRILQTYRDVLRLHGTPRRVYRGDESVHIEDKYDAEGNLTGGFSLSDTTGGGGGGAGRGGAPAMGGPGMGGSGGRMMPGGPGKMGGPGMMPGGPGMGGSGGPGMMAGGGGGVGAGADAETTFRESGGFIWAYEDTANQLISIYAFNADGRLIIVTEMGRWKGGKSERGVGLGDPVKNVYKAYGWPEDIQDQGSAFVLHYGSQHAEFVILKNKVIGITIFLRENTRLSYFQEGNGGGGGGARGGPGMAGSGGMMGGPGGKRLPSPAGGGGGAGTGKMD